MTQIILKVTIALVTLFSVSTSQINDEYSEEYDCPYSIFKQAFYDGLASSDDTFEQYNIAMPPQFAYDAFYKVSIKFYSALRAHNPKEIADTRASAAVYRAECITKEQLANVNSNAIEEILEKTGTITNENAAFLAKRYLKYLERQRNARGYDGSPQANLKSIFDAGQYFIKDTVHHTKNLGDIVSECFKNNFKTLNCCCALPQDE